tara:strand:- start:109 stop:288 length:180 start_codon:yes stop_codon:yes gene_type:complete
LVLLLLLLEEDVIVVVDDEEDDVVEDGEKPEKLVHVAACFSINLTGKLLEHIGHCPYSL